MERVCLLKMLIQPQPSTTPRSLSLQRRPAASAARPRARAVPPCKNHSMSATTTREGQLMRRCLDWGGAATPSKQMATMMHACMSVDWFCRTLRALPPEAPRNVTRPPRWTRLHALSLLVDVTGLFSNDSP